MKKWNKIAEMKLKELRFGALQKESVVTKQYYNGYLDALDDMLNEVKTIK